MKNKIAFAQINGIELHYREVGDGPLIILLHGWPETSYTPYKASSINMD